MKKISYRTTLPFHGHQSFDNKGYYSITPLDNRSVIPFNNVPRFGDDPKSWLPGSNEWNWEDEFAQGNQWNPSSDQKTQKEIKNLIKLIEEHEAIPQNIEKWKVQTKDGYRIFEEYEIASEYYKKNRKDAIYITRLAQSNNVGKYLSQTFSIQSVNPSSNSMESGTCFCIGHKLFATCAHCIMAYDKNNIPHNTNIQSIKTSIITSQEIYRAEILDIDFEKDLAILKSDLQVTAFEFDKETAVGTEIFVIGNSLGYDSNVSSGILSGINRKVYDYPNAPSFIFFDANVTSGNSGGPIINKQNGNLIGMVVLVVGDEETGTVNAGIPYSYIESKLKTISNKGEL